MIKNELSEDICLEEVFHIERFRVNYGHVLSSHAFASLFLWKEQMKLQIVPEDDAFFVKTGLQGSDVWFFPCGQKRDTLEFIEQHMDNPSFGMV